LLFWNDPFWENERENESQTDRIYS
jgi:hypothetical protein